MNELPAGFTMALSQNQTALKKFAEMTEFEKDSVIEWAQNVRSQQEMQQLVHNIANNAQG